MFEVPYRVYAVNMEWIVGYNAGLILVVYGFQSYAILSIDFISSTTAGDRTYKGKPQ